mgnify:CR=1 FL=1
MKIKNFKYKNIGIYIKNIIFVFFKNPIRYFRIAGACYGGCSKSKSVLVIYGVEGEHQYVDNDCLEEYFVYLWTRNESKSQVTQGNRYINYSNLIVIPF